MIESFRGAHRALREAGGLRRRVGIKRRAFYVAASRPESGADHFMGIGFARDGIRTSAFRRSAAREARHRKIETAPEKMDRAGFADEAGAKFLENRLAANKNPPETIGVFGIVRGVLCILI